MTQEAAERKYRWSGTITFIVLVGMLFVAWQSAKISGENAIVNLQDLSRQQLNLYVANLQGQLEKYESLPELLATNKRLIQILEDPVNSQQIDELNRYLSMINKIVDASDIYLMDEDGLTIAASNWQSETPFIGRNFSYRPYFQEAMKGNLGRYFALGTTSNKRGYYFAYPVRGRTKILGALVVKITLTEIEQNWTSGDYEFIVTDPDGVIFITSNPNWRFNTLQPLPADIQRRIIESRRYLDSDLKAFSATFEHRSEDVQIMRFRPPTKKEYLVVEQSMPEAGWKVHILADMKRVDAQIWRSVVVALALFAAVVLMLLILHQRRRRMHERMRFEQQVKRNLEANEAKIRAILENTQAGLLLMDTLGHIELANSKALELFGYKAGEMNDEPFLPCFSEASQDTVSQIFNADNRQVMTIETMAKRRGSESFPVELTVGMLRLSGETKRIATIHDISYRVAQEEALRQAHNQLEERVEERTRDLSTSNIRLVREIEEHRQTEKALRETQDQLIQAAKLAALGQMSTSISHELNQPLAAIRSYADNARARVNNERVADACWNMEQISELTERMARISSQLKVFSRKTTGQLIRVSLTAAVETSIQILGPRIKETETTINNALPETELYVVADMVQLEQVIVNLIDNAIHAVEPLDRRIIDITASDDGDLVCLRIQDSGSGIDTENIGRIFDPFFTTKEEGRGLGLGLSISHRIVESMNGRLKAENDPNGGAVFTVELPSANLN